MNTNAILVMYSVIVGLEVGKALCHSHPENVFISIISLMGLSCILLFNNPGQASTLEAIMWTTIAISTAGVTAIAFIIIFQEEEDFSSSKETENVKPQPEANDLQCSIQPQQIEELLQRHDRIRRSLAYRKAELP